MKVKDSVVTEKQWWERLERADCQKCKFRRECGDIFPQVGKCPSNSGGESWAKFVQDEPMPCGGR